MHRIARCSRDTTLAFIRPASLYMYVIFPKHLQWVGHEILNNPVCVYFHH